MTQSRFGNKVDFLRAQKAVYVIKENCRGDGVIFLSWMLSAAALDNQPDNAYLSPKLINKTTVKLQQWVLR